MTAPSDQSAVPPPAEGLPSADAMPGAEAVAQASEANFALHTLGWKAFQDLAVAVAAEVLERPVQVFLPSKDGGRDGAFVGTWPGSEDAPEAKSTIQCKFIGKPGATVRLSDVQSELSKIASLAERGLAHDYILLTNAGVSGEAEAAITTAFKAAGATNARVLGREWLTAEIRARPRLRMMVPRLYGLGDLSQIIDQRAYLQARYILSAMGDDLAAFVTTAAHRQSVEALRRHRFVLLLGDPASGKSTIGASLAVGALDDGAIGTVRISNAEAFERHWNPHEPTQFFWIDDAFGETQYQRSRVDGWNSRLKMISAAVKAGARVLMTSRTYIWNAAQRDLKLSEFPLLTNSQVIIDVQSLTDLERAQILYNHLRLGEQPSSFRLALKPFLPAIAVNSDFLPETARRLGSTFFTGELKVNADGVNDFFEHPLAFLKDVLRGLGDGERAAVALIFLHGPGGVQSPISQSEALDIVCRLTGVAAAEVSRAMEALQGSLTLLIEAPDGRRWTFKHPTVADAFAELVAESPEMVELYILGAKLEKLLGEVVCGAVELRGASVHVPPSRFDMLLTRMEERDFSERELLQFATYRGDAEFLAKFTGRVGDMSPIVQAISSDMMFSTQLKFIVAAHAAGLLDETTRVAAVEKISELCLSWADVEPFRNRGSQSLFSADEHAELADRFRREIVEDVGLDPAEWNDRIVAGDRRRHMNDLKDAIETFAEYYGDDLELAQEAARAANLIEDFIETLDDDDDEAGGPSAPVTSSLTPTDHIASIFDDVDD